MIKPIPITVFTGFLGAGKTSIILSLLPQLPKDYRVVLLKNEFGDIEVDSKLAEQSSLAAVSEILNGCMCCVLVGQMERALLEIKEKYHPDRIIIECSGSAFPATLAFQIRKLEQETGGGLKLDAIVTVIDAENFRGYEDTSPTAKMQASYSDIILINKWEYTSDRELDLVMDHLHTLNDLTPKIRCNGRNGVDPNLIFGAESTLFTGSLPESLTLTHTDEVETVTIYRGSRRDHDHANGRCDCQEDLKVDSEGRLVELHLLEGALNGLSKEVVWRVKGFIRLNRGDGRNSCYILNWAFGRFDITAYSGEYLDDATIRLTIMGERGEVKRAADKFLLGLY